MTTRNEMFERKEQIIKLRKQGYTNKQIAEELKLPYRTIVDTARRLIQANQLSRRPGGPQSILKQGKHRHHQAIIDMYKANIPYSEMSQRLQIPFGTLAAMIHRLKAAGFIDIVR